jgi:hypothetical protein
MGHMEGIGGKSPTLGTAAGIGGKVPTFSTMAGIGDNVTIGMTTGTAAGIGGTVERVATGTIDDFGMTGMPGTAAGVTGGGV